MKITAEIVDPADSLGFCGVRLLKPGEPGNHYLAMPAKLAYAFCDELARLNAVDEMMRARLTPGTPEGLV